MMASEGKGPSSFGYHFNEIKSHQGIAGFYRGISTNVTRAMVLNATKMGSNFKNISKLQIYKIFQINLKFNIILI